jgi:hypothetical protein
LFVACVQVRARRDKCAHVQRVSIAGERRHHGEISGAKVLEHLELVLLQY